MADVVQERQTLLVDLINTRHCPDGDDVLEDERAGAWLLRHLSPDRDEERPVRADRRPPSRPMQDLVRLREGLRQLARINNGAEPEHDALDDAARTLAANPMTLHLATPGSAAGLTPATGDPAARVFARAATAYLAESAAGTWRRVKACANSDCQYAYVDRSRNGSRRWCDMAGCGNQAKQHGYRRRQRTGSPR